MKIAPQQLCGHRGVAAHAPENTLMSISKVREMGLSWVEIDVQLTQDGVPVVFHDHNLLRCTNGAGALKDTPLAELQQLDAGGHFSPTFEHERVPTLAAVLAQAHRDALHINLEIKTYPDSDIPALCRAIFTCLSASPISLEKVLVSSFSLEALAIVRDEMPELSRAILWETIPENWYEFRDLATFSIHCNYRHLTQEKAKSVKDSGLALKCYTPNEPAEVEALWDWGVDMMITDDPGKYLTHSY